MNATIRTLDVREGFRSGEHPGEKIRAALNNIGAGETLRLLVPFEPVPLFQVAASKGLGHKSNQTAEGHWEVLFTHNTTAPVLNHRALSDANASGYEITAKEEVDVDARGLEPPQPLVRILEAVGQLPRGATLRARIDRRPIHLYPALMERGFIGESEEQTDGSFITHIHHA